MSEKRKQAIKLCRTEPIARVARKLGVSRPTLYAWINEDAPEILDQCPRCKKHRTKITKLETRLAELQGTQPTETNNE